MSRSPSGVRLKPPAWAVPNADHNEELFAVSSTTVQDWLHQWQEQGLLEPFRPGHSPGAVDPQLAAARAVGRSGF
jgi:hypothetical protein